MKKVIGTCGYPSLDRLIKIDGDIAFGKTSIITNHENDKVSFGGCAQNIAYILARLNVPARTYFVAGNDFETSGYKAFLESAGVDISGVSVDKSCQTSKSYILENEEGNHVTLYYMGAMKNPKVKAINLEDLAMGVLTVGNKSCNKSFKNELKMRQIPIVFSMKFDSNAFSKEDIFEYLFDSAYIFMNQCEFDAVKDFLQIELDDFFKGECKCLVVTKGKNGSDIYYKEDKSIKTLEIGIAKAEKIVDSLGVGDAFVAGFLYGLSLKKCYQYCGRVAAVVASFVLEGKGCTDNIPTSQMIKIRYKENY